MEGLEVGICGIPHIPFLNVEEKIGTKNFSLDLGIRWLKATCWLGGNKIPLGYKYRSERY